MSGTSPVVVSKGFVCEAEAGAPVRPGLRSI